MIGILVTSCRLLRYLKKEYDENDSENEVESAQENDLTEVVCKDLI